MRPTVRDGAILVTGQPEAAAGQAKTGRSNRTLTSDLFQRLRTDILHCNLRPNSRLPGGPARLVHVRDESGGSDATRVRRPAILEDHKGFGAGVARRTRRIASTRCEIEGRALEMSIEAGDDHWEANTGAFSDCRKANVRRQRGWTTNGSGGMTPFISPSMPPGLTWMSSFVRCWPSAPRYRHLLLEVVDRTRDHRSEHEAIQHAAIARDGGTAVRLLKDHYMRTVQTLLDNWTELR
jgi:hypothetical protein